MVEPRKDDVPFEWLTIPDPLDVDGGRRPTGPLPIPTGGLASQRSRAPSPTRRTLATRRAVALLAATLYCLLVLLAVHPQHGLLQRLAPIASATALWVLFGALGLATALRRTRIGLAIPAVIPVFATISAALAFVGYAWVTGLTQAPLASAGAFGYRAFAACFSIGISVAVPVLALAAWALGRPFASGARARGSAVGASAGLLGIAVLTLHCGIRSWGHLVLAHGLPLLLAVALGSLVVGRTARS